MLLTLRYSKQPFQILVWSVDDDWKCGHEVRRHEPVGRILGEAPVQALGDDWLDAVAEGLGWEGRGCYSVLSTADFLALKHESSILGHSSIPVWGFSMMEQVRLCAVWPMENCIGSSLNQIQGWTTFVL